MNNRAIGVKKSQFIAGTSISGSATFDYVENGQNIKITFTDLLSNLGVSGSIEQVGGPLDVPVLDIQGDINGIRNIAGGRGIAASVSPQNSVEIATDFTFDDTGAALVDDPDADAPAFRSLVGGNAINLTESVGQILLDYTGSPNPDNEVSINSVDDFAVQNANTITLEEGKVYIQGATISTDKRFIVEPNVAVVSGNPGDSVLWEYTGTGDMFTGVDCKFFNGMNLSVRCENANQIFNFTDSTPGTTIFKLNTCIAYPKDDVSIAAKKWGTFTDLLTVLIEDSSCVNGLGIEDGITLGGTQIGLLSISKFALLSNSATYTGLDLGNAVVSTAFELFNFVNIGLAPGSVGITGLPSSGNVGTDIVSSVRDCEFIGFITPLVNISESDLKYEFINNSPVPNSSRTADVYLTLPRVVPISTQDQWEPVGGTDWTSDISERFSFTTDGVLTYLSPVDAKVQILISATMEQSGGGSDQLELTIGIDGVCQTKSIVGSENGDPVNVVSVGLFALTEGATIDACVRNTSDTSNIEVDNCMISIINGF